MEKQGGAGGSSSRRSARRSLVFARVVLGVMGLYSLALPVVDYFLTSYAMRPSLALDTVSVLSEAGRSAWRAVSLTAVLAADKKLYASSFGSLFSSAAVDIPTSEYRTMDIVVGGKVTRQELGQDDDAESVRYFREWAQTLNGIHNDPALGVFNSYYMDPNREQKRRERLNGTLATGIKLASVNLTKGYLFDFSTSVDEWMDVSGNFESVMCLKNLTLSTLANLQFDSGHHEPLFLGFLEDFGRSTFPDLYTCLQEETLEQRMHFILEFSPKLALNAYKRGKFIGNSLQLARHQEGGMDLGGGSRLQVNVSAAFRRELYTYRWKGTWDDVLGAVREAIWLCLFWPEEAPKVYGQDSTSDLAYLRHCFKNFDMMAEYRASGWNYRDFPNRVPEIYLRPERVGNNSRWIWTDISTSTWQSVLQVPLHPPVSMHFEYIRGLYSRWLAPVFLSPSTSSSLSSSTAVPELFLTQPPEQLTSLTICSSDCQAKCQGDQLSGIWVALSQAKCQKMELPSLSAPQLYNRTNCLDDETYASALARSQYIVKVGNPSTNVYINRTIPHGEQLLTCLFEGWVAESVLPVEAYQVMEDNSDKPIQVVMYFGSFQTVQVVMVILGLLGSVILTFDTLRVCYLTFIFLERAEGVGAVGWLAENTFIKLDPSYRAIRFASFSFKLMLTAAPGSVIISNVIYSYHWNRVNGLTAGVNGLLGKLLTGSFTQVLQVLVSFLWIGNIWGDSTDGELVGVRKSSLSDKFGRVLYYAFTFMYLSEVISVSAVMNEWDLRINFYAGLDCRLLATVMLALAIYKVGYTVSDRILVQRSDLLCVKELLKDCNVEHIYVKPESLHGLQGEAGLEISAVLDLISRLPTRRALHLISTRIHRGHYGTHLDKCKRLTAAKAVSDSSGNGGGQQSSQKKDNRKQELEKFLF